jgi:methyl-accepting chemotaxis protein
MKKNGSGSRKLILGIVALLLIVAMGCVVYFELQERKQLVRETENKYNDTIIKYEVQAVNSMLQNLYDNVDKKTITLNQAKLLGADLIRNMRYGTEGYFWADTSNGTNIALYGDRSVEGKNRYNNQLRGIYYVKDIIAAGMQPGGGYTEYYFTKLGAPDVVKKRAFSLFFEPFGWIIGTGYYPL